MPLLTPTTTSPCRRTRPRPGDTPLPAQSRSAVPLVTPSAPTRRSRQLRPARTGALLLTGAAAVITLTALVTAIPREVIGLGPATAEPPRNMPAPSAPASERTLTDDQLAGLTPQQQAARLDPLRAAAAALDLSMRADPAAAARLGYAGVRIDAGSGQVDVYLTSPQRSADLLAAAHRQDPAAGLGLVRVRPADHDRVTLETGALRLLDLSDAGRLPFTVYAAGPAADGSGIAARVDDVAAADRFAARPSAALGGRTLAQVTGAALRPVHGAPMVPKSWADQKWHDTSPFIGGDALTGSGSGAGCTAGLPAVRRSTGRPVLITAAHCFRTGAKVYTRGGVPGRYGNGLRGAYVGTVTGRYPSLDAVTIEGGDNRASVSLTSTWAPLRSAGYSYVGDLVCHAGQRSYFLGHPTPCNIRVTDADLWCSARSGCPGLGYRVRGAWGDALGHGARHGWGAAGGDSGATIFAVTGRGLQARGVLSDGDPGDGAPGVFWSQAPDVFAHFGLRLNPRS
ncbi:MAG TPA: hypothetical protein VFP72_12940 [Kineosporiaceae bacterium]|nr:hypothetical protein [Kineosporiaceae bacterium]